MAWIRTAWIAQWIWLPCPLVRRIDGFAEFTIGVKRIGFVPRKAVTVDQAGVCLSQPRPAAVFVALRFRDGKQFSPAVEVPVVADGDRVEQGRIARRERVKAQAAAAAAAVFAAGVWRRPSEAL